MSVNDQPPVVNPPTEDLMGYANATELARAKRSTDAELQRIRTENEQLRQFAANQRPEPTTRRPEDELEALGISPTTMDRYFDDRLGRALAPLAQQINGQAQGRARMLAVHGQDYTKYEADVATHVQSDPDLNQRYQRMFAADPEGAMDYVFRHYSDSKRKEANERVRGDRRQQTEASMPTARTGEGPANQASQEGELLQRAREHFDKTGRAEPYAKIRLRNVITPEHLGER